jgi:hypothetical protein
MHVLSHQAPQQPKKPVNSMTAPSAMMMYSAMYNCLFGMFVHLFCTITYPFRWWNVRAGLQDNLGDDLLEVAVHTQPYARGDG